MPWDSTMKRNLFAVFVACSLLLTIDGCKKYEEGPYLSFQGKFDRVVNVWKAKNVFRGLTDVTAWYTDWELDLREDGRLVLTDRDELDSLVVQNGFWDLVNDNEDLQFVYADPPVSPDRATVMITKLKDDALWYQMAHDTVTWEFRLMPADTAL